VKLRVFGCRKFRRLVSDALDRELSPGEGIFMGRHRSVCQTCRTVERQSSLALNMLREAAFESQPSIAFEDRVLRLWRVQRMRARVAYWSPAVFGAAIAGIAILAALQMISHSSKMPSVPVRGTTIEAKNRPALDVPLPSINFIGPDSARQ
jgi:predicted anti-sigma-YlaC factor YlaD